MELDTESRGLVHSSFETPTFQCAEREIEIQFPSRWHSWHSNIQLCLLAIRSKLDYSGGGLYTLAINCRDTSLGFVSNEVTVGGSEKRQFFIALNPLLSIGNYYS